MEKGCRQKEQGHRSRGQHKGVNPGVRGRAQPAHEEEQKEAAHRVEDPRRGQPGLAQDDEEANAEEGEPEKSCVEVGCAADLSATELDGNLKHMARGAHQIGDRLTDTVPVQELLGMGRGIEEEGAVDPDDHVSRPDTGDIGPGTGHHAAHDPRTRNVRFQDDAVVRTRKEHVRNRQGGNEKREYPGRQRQSETPLRPLHHHIIRFRHSISSRLHLNFLRKSEFFRRPTCRKRTS